MLFAVCLMLDSIDVTSFLKVFPPLLRGCDSSFDIGLPVSSRPVHRERETHGPSHTVRTPTDFYDVLSYNRYFRSKTLEKHGFQSFWKSEITFREWHWLKTPV
jgi:hypothetical protein